MRASFSSFDGVQRLALITAALLHATLLWPVDAAARSLDLQDGAQTEAEEPLTPQTGPDEEEPQEQEKPVTTITLPPPTNPGISPTVRTLAPDAPITIGTQAELSLDDFGLLDPGNGGFSANTWQGSAREEIAEMLPLIPEGVASPSLRAGLTKLLLTRAKAPQPRNAGDKNAPDFLGLRLQTLLKLGSEEKALALIKALPASFTNEKTVELGFDIALLHGDITAACADVQKNLDRYDTLEWQKRMIFCHAVQKRNDEAQLGVDLLAEQNRNSGTFFANLIQLMLHPKSKVTLSLPERGAVSDYAMLVASGVPLPRDFAAKAPPPALRTAAKQKDLAAPIRAEILEKSVMFGMSPPAPLVEAYKALNSSKETKDKKARSAVATRAAMYQSVADAKDEKKLAQLSQALTLYAQDHLEPLAFMLYLPTAKETVSALRDGGALPANLDIFSLLLAGGEDALAERYLNLLPLKTHAFQKSAGKLMLDFYRYRGGALTATMSAPENAPAADIKRQFRLNRLIAAFDIKLNEEKRGALATARVKYDVEMPSPDLLDAFAKARTAKSQGKLLLLSALLIGDADMAHASDMVLEQIIRGFREAGLEKEARALALEAMVTAGY